MTNDVFFPIHPASQANPKPSQLYLLLLRLILHILYILATILEWGKNCDHRVQGTQSDLKLNQHFKISESLSFPVLISVFIYVQNFFFLCSYLVSNVSLIFITLSSSLFWFMHAFFSFTGFGFRTTLHAYIYLASQLSFWFSAQLAIVQLIQLART